MKKLLTVILSVTILILSAFTLAGCNAVNISDITLEPLPALDPVYGVNPGEGIVIDGNADEQEWENKKYFKNSDIDKGVSYYATSHLTEKGVYVYAYSEDNWVCYSNRNNYKKNTHFYLILTAKEGQSSYNEGVCRSMKIDTTAYTMPTNFYYTAASKAIGEVNSGESEGMSVEVFVSWEQLGYEETETKPEEVRLYCAYMSIPRLNADGAYVSNTFSSTAPETHHLYNASGYVNTTDEVLGTSAYGTVSSGGITATADGMEITGGGKQTAYFNVYSDKFIIETTLKSNGAVYNKSTIAKAGFIMSNTAGFYTATMFDLRTLGSNVNVLENGTVKNERLIKLCNYPNAGQVRTTVMYEGSNTGYSELTLKIIKDRETVYYLVNGELVTIEVLDWMQSEVCAGIYSLNADCVFSDYSCTDCATDSETLQAEIDAVASQIKYQQDPSVRFSSQAPAVKNGEDAQVSLFVKSGRTIDTLKNNGVDITEEMRSAQTAEMLNFTAVNEKINLTATTKEITDSVTVTGKVTTPTGAKVPYAYVYIIGEKPYTSYYAIADKNGEYEIKVEKNNEYKVSVTVDGYRTTERAITIGNDSVADADIVLENFVVGGKAGSYTSNTASWDLTKESDAIVTLDLQDRTSGGVVYFSDIISDTVVITVTVTNRTNMLISEPYYKTGSNANGEYENDPGAGIVVRNSRGSSYYMVYHTGYRNRWNNGSYGDMHLWTPREEDGYKSMRYNGKSKTMTLMRYKSQFFMYVDGEFVYAKENTRLGDEPASYAFGYDSSAILNMVYSNYSIISGDEAKEYIFSKLYSKFVFDDDMIEVSGLQKDGDNYYGLYNTTPVIKIKNGINSGEVYKVTVNDKDYYLSSTNNAISYTVDEYSDTAMPDITITAEKHTGYKVSGKTSVKSNITIIKSDGSARTSTTTDNSGNYSLYLPNGTYNIIATASGYIGKYTTVTVSNGAVTAPTITLGAEVIASSVKLGSATINSRTSAYKYAFNETTLKHAVKADSTGNGGAVFFGVTATDAMIKFSFIKNSGNEPDAGVGLWVATANDPGVNPKSIRFLLKNTKSEAYWRKTTGNTLNVDRGYVSKTEKGDYTNTNDIRETGVEFNAIFIRRNNTYYYFVKKATDSNYQIMIKYQTDLIEGAAAYGFTVTATQGNTLDLDFYDYSLVSTTSEIDAQLSALGQ